MAEAQAIQHLRLFNCGLARDYGEFPHLAKLLVTIFEQLIAPPSSPGTRRLGDGRGEKGIPLSNYPPGLELERQCPIG